MTRIPKISSKSSPKVSIIKCTHRVTFALDVFFQDMAVSEITVDEDFEYFRDVGDSSFHVFFQCDSELGIIRRCLHFF